MRMLVIKENSRLPSIDEQIKEIQTNIDENLGLLREIRRSQISNLPLKKLDKLIKTFTSLKQPEILIVAPMSAGKSTLINSLLASRIVPASQEACTSTIVRLFNSQDKKDVEAFDEDNNCIASGSASIDELTTMNELSEAVRIDASLPIQFAGDAPVTVIDTPGPNNALNKAHQNVLFEFLDHHQAELTLFIMNGTQLGTDSEKQLLDRIIETQPNVVFVLNKMDEFRTNEDITNVLENVRKYLENQFSIQNPRIFPVSAQFALDLQIHMKNQELVMDEWGELTFSDHSKQELMSSYSRNELTKIQNTLTIANNFMLNEDLHLNQYAPVTVNDSFNGCYERLMAYSGVTGLADFLNEFIKNNYLNELRQQDKDLFDLIRFVLEEIFKILDNSLDNSSEEKLKKHIRNDFKVIDQGQSEWRKPRVENLYQYFKTHYPKKESSYHYLMFGNRNNESFRYVVVLELIYEYREIELRRNKNAVIH